MPKSAKHVRVVVATGLALTVVLAGACGEQKAGVGDSGALDAGKDLLALDLGTDATDVGPPPSCEGTVSATGTSPYGSFVASVANVIFVNGRAIEVYLYDPANAAHLDFWIPPRSPDAGTTFSFSGEIEFGGFLTPGVPLGNEVEVKVSVDAVGTDPYLAPDAGGSWGSIQGTFSVLTAGYSISGAFFSPYCKSVLAGGGK